MEQQKDKNVRVLWVVIAFLLVLQYVSRYGPAPVTDFTTDDWSFLYRAQQFSSLADVWRYCLLDSVRPIHLGVITSTFYLLGAHPLAYAIFTALAMSALLVLAVLLVYMLTDRLVVCFLFGALFALWPTMTENFHYYNVIPITQHCSYVLCAIFWIKYLRAGRVRWLFLSGVAYSIGLFSYELGWLLPIPLFVLSIRKNIKAGLLGTIALFVLLAMCLVWRFTMGFGLTQNLLCGPEYFQPEISLWMIRHGIYSVASWWAGFDLWRSVGNGGAAFLRLSPSVFYLWASINLLMAILLVRLGHGVQRDSRSPAGEFALWQLVLFGLLWWSSGHAAHSLAGTSGRHVVFPSIGLFLVVAALSSLIVEPRKTSKWPIVLLAMVALSVNQGTALSWKESGSFNRNLFQHVSAWKEEWMGREYVLFDTASLATRLKEPILDLSETTPRHWAYNGNAHLLRGFALQAMIDFNVEGSRRGPLAILDREYGAKIADGTMVWHDRYDPSRPHTNSLADVFTIDCLEAGQLPQ